MCHNLLPTQKKLESKCQLIEFLVEKNPKLFRSLGSTVWRKLSNEPENLRKMIHKAKTMVKLGRQKYELNRKINGSK